MLVKVFILISNLMRRSKQSGALKNSSSEKNYKFTEKHLRLSHLN